MQRSHAKNFSISENFELIFSYPTIFCCTDGRDNRSKTYNDHSIADMILKKSNRVKVQLNIIGIGNDLDLKKIGSLAGKKQQIK
jgi:hypothetical protein